MSARPDPSVRRLLVLAERLPRPDESSGSCRFLAILSHLARRGPVDLWVERDETTGRTALPAARVARDRERLTGLGIQVLPLPFHALRAAIHSHAYDRVLFEMHDVAARYLPTVRTLLPGAALIVDSVDVHFARLAAAEAVGAVNARDVRRMRRAETGVYRRADAVVVVSREDAGALDGEPGMPAIVQVPNCVTLRPRVTVSRSPTALFVGHFNHAPNLDGLRWYVRNVWPLVVARRPDASTTVVGSHASAEVHALGRASGIDVRGYVPDLQPIVDQSAVAIAPLRYGAGMKGKVTDALAAGMPLVTTSVGAQGLDLVNGRHAFVTDDPVAFADALVTLFDDPSRAGAIGLAGQRYVDDVCGPEATARALAVLTAVTRRESPPSPSSMTIGGRLLVASRGVRHAVMSVARRHARWLAVPETSLTGTRTAQRRS